MDAPIEWTYNGEVNWERAKLCSHQLLIRPIIEALKERGSIFDYTLPEILTNDYNPLNPPSVYTEAIEGVMDEFLANFVNHEDNSGLWDNQEEIPVWDEISMLAAIGDEERLPPRMPGFADWAMQQYKMINKFRWVKKILAVDDVLNYNTYGSAQHDPSPSGAISAAEATALSYGLRNYASKSEFVNFQHCAILSTSYDGYVGYVWTSSGIFKTTMTEAESYLSYTEDIYIKAKAFRPDSETTSTTFVPNNWNIYQDAFGRVYTSAVEKNDIEYASPRLGDYTFYGQPPTPGESENTIRGWDPAGNATAPAADAFMGVFKFDGENGFQFKDW